MRRIIAGALVIAGLASPVLAQSTFKTVTNPKQMLERFDVTNVTGILTEMGLKNEVMAQDNGAAVIRAVTNTGMVFVLYPVVCSEGARAKCAGLELDVIFTADAPGASYATVNQFNREYALTKAFLSSRGEPVLSRYILADHGIARGNVVSNVTNFVRLSEVFRTTLANSLLAQYNDGTPDERLGRAFVSTNQTLAHPQAALVSTSSITTGMIANRQYADEYVNYIGRNSTGEIKIK